MNSPRLKNEGWLYTLAFISALAFRFIQLGAMPLTDSEASLALQAFHIAQGKATLLNPQPLYILLTSVFFLVVQSTNFLARFFPALVGSSLVFAPLLFREKLKPRPALLLAFFFAFDPGLVALSRQASGAILAVTFLLFAWGTWRNGRLIPAGIFAGLALLSGPSIWSGLLILILTALFLRGMGLQQNMEMPSKETIRVAGLSLLATLIIAGTRFFTIPNGLSAWLASIPAYFSGWVATSTFSPSRVLLIFATYEPLGIFLVILALIRGIRLKSPRITRLGIWLAVALLFAIFYRQTSELIWVIIPMLVLAAQELSRSFDIYEDERVEFGVVAGAIMILLTYIWFNVANVGLNPYEQITNTPLLLFNKIIQIPLGPRYIVLIGASVILVICLGLVALGWSARTARVGATWAFALFFSVYAVGTAWGTSGMRTPDGMELWSTDQSPIQANLLLKSVDDISMYSTGDGNAQPVTIMGVQSPALEWLLRNHEVKIVQTLDPQFAPPIVITPVMNDLGVPSAYRGEGFTWRQPPNWANIKSPDWLKWMVYRQLPGTPETIIVWARNDLFIDARQSAP